MAVSVENQARSVTVPAGSNGDIQINNNGVFGSVTPIANGVYVMGLGLTQNGVITITNGIITAIQQVI